MLHSLAHFLYVYGGWDGQVACNTLHQLDTTTMTWKEMVPNNPSEAPMKMSGCGMVSFGDHKLVLFGGYGVPSENAKPGSVFYQRNMGGEEKGWTNELRVFNIEEGIAFHGCTLQMCVALHVLQMCVVCTEMVLCL